MAAKKPSLTATARKAREKFLLEITSLPTAAGREDRVIAAIEKWVAARKARLVLSRDRFGNMTVARHDFLEACARGAKAGVKPVMITAHLDLPLYAATLLGAAVVGLLAAVAPARRAARLDPATAIRL